MPDLELENQYKGLSIAGVDEVGRGCIAGSVVAAAVILPKELPEILYQMNDSKLLSAKKRQLLYDVIITECHYGIGVCNEAEIDEINILQASLLAMRRAVENLNILPELALVDGNQKPGLPCEVITVIKGDSKSLSIAAASIIAKVYRDTMMQQLHNQYPNYQWNQNKGYPSKAHKDSLMKFGITPHHRLSFAPCKIMASC